MRNPSGGAPYKEVPTTSPHFGPTTFCSEFSLPRPLFQNKMFRPDTYSRSQLRGSSCKGLQPPKKELLIGELFLPIDGAPDEELQTAEGRFFPP